MSKKYTLTPEHKARFPEWRDWWIANAFSCEAMTDTDRWMVGNAIASMYDAAKLPPPRVSFVASPFVAAVAAGVAAAVWHVRECGLPDGTRVSEAQMMAAIPTACRIAIMAGWERGERSSETTATHAATRDATDDATDVATNAATKAATNAATDVATNAATSVATNDATNAATHDAAYDATYAATDAATRAATGDGIVNDVTVVFYLRCVEQSWRLRGAGNQWSGWSAYLSFFRYVAQLPIDYSAWDHWEVCAIRSGPRYVHAKFCLVSDRPERLDHDGPIPHRADGPSHIWRDGFSASFWRGQMVPNRWLRGELTATEALGVENLDQRSAACEILGWARILEELPHRVIDTDADPQIGQLIHVDLPDAPASPFLRVRCATGRDFALPVPAEMRTALDANAWTYPGISAAEMRGLEVRT